MLRFVSYVSLFAVCCLLVGGWCSLCAVACRCESFVGCRALFVVCCVVRGSLCMVCRLLFVVCCLYVVRC